MSPYLAYFPPEYVRTERIWPKIATDEAGDLRNRGNEVQGIGITLKSMTTIAMDIYRFERLQ